jgi:hypothetical protein
MRKRLIDTVYANVTVDGAKQTAAVECPEAETLCYQVLASAASSPSGTTIQIQGSLDGTNWTALGSAVSVTGNGVFASTETTCAYRYYRLAYARSSGSYVATTRILAKGEVL